MRIETTEGNQEPLNDLEQRGLEAHAEEVAEEVATEVAAEIGLNTLTVAVETSAAVAEQVATEAAREAGNEVWEQVQTLLSDCREQIANLHSRLDSMEAERETPPPAETLATETVEIPLNAEEDARREVETEIPKRKAWSLFG